MSKMEVLAPCGSFESVVSAVRSGADALYLGAKSFSARARANNFDDQELAQTVSYCHQRGVKVYVAVNILIKEQELTEAMNLIDYLNQIEVDAVIVQDLGLAKLIKENYPKLALHGSTQMSIHQKDGLKLLEKWGYERIVTAREINKKQLEEFVSKAKSLDIEVEHFVHGALCMSVSGQCQLSAMLGSRSGNRGQCAQPCRLPFKAKNGTGYDLSLKDECLLTDIEDLKRIGVDSLKIEGRLKRSEYVAVAVSATREAVDNGKIDDELYQLLRDVFSRGGFTDGYFQNKLGKEMFGIRSQQDKDASSSVLNKIHQLYRKERNSVGVKMTLKVENNCLVLTLTDGNHVVEAISETLEKSNESVNKEKITSLLTKLGNSCYYLEEVKIDINENYLLPSSLINSLKREVVEKLDEERKKINFRESKKVELSFENKKHKLNKMYGRISQQTQLTEGLKKLDGLIFPIDMDADYSYGNLIVEIPRYIKNENYIYQRLNELKQQGVSKAYCNNISAVSMALDLGFEVMGGNFLNITNSASCLRLKELKISDITISSELSFKEISKIKTTENKGIISYGYLPLMLLVNCPLKNGRNCADCDHNGYLVDRKNTKFPVRCQLAVSELFNSKPIYLSDKQNDYLDVDYQILYFTIEDKEQIEKVINDYLNKSNNCTDYTRGLYYRSVI